MRNVHHVVTCSSVQSSSLFHHIMSGFEETTSSGWLLNELDTDIPYLQMITRLQVFTITSQSVMPLLPCSLLAVLSQTHRWAAGLDNSESSASGLVEGKFLLAFAGIVIHGSEPYGTHDHIYGLLTLSHEADFNLVLSGSQADCCCLVNCFRLLLTVIFLGAMWEP